MKDAYFVRIIDYSLKPDDEGYETIQLCGKKDIIKTNQANSDVWYRYIETIERQYHNGIDIIDIFRQQKESGVYFKWDDITNLVTFRDFNQERFFFVLQYILDEMNDIKTEYDEYNENIVTYINPRKKQGLQFIKSDEYNQIKFIQYE